MTDLAELERSITEAHVASDEQRLHALQAQYRAARPMLTRIGGTIEFRTSTTRRSGGRSSTAGAIAQSLSSTLADDVPTIVQRAPWTLDDVPTVIVSSEIREKLEAFEDEINGHERIAWIFGDAGTHSIHLLTLDGIYTGSSPFTAVAHGRDEAIALAQRRRCHLLGLIHSHPQERRQMIEPSRADLLNWQANAVDASSARIFVGGVVTPSNNPYYTRGTEWCSPRSAWWLADARTPDVIYQVHPRTEVA